MKLEIDRENDALYLRLDETPIIESEEVQPQVQEQIVELFTEYVDFVVRREDAIRVHIKSKSSSVD